MSSVQNTCSKGDDLFRQHLFRSSVCQILSSERNFWGEANLVGFVLRHLPIGPMMNPDSPNQENSCDMTSFELKEGIN